MKTLEDHVILYDKDCPVCDLYTSTFIKTNMLDPTGRIAFKDADQLISKHHVNRAKACDEIAVINKKTGSVKYGIYSLMLILSYRFPFLSRLFENTIFKFFASTFYSFISFNRKVIVPGKNDDDPNGCTPSFSLRYRLSYIVFTWLVTSFILAKYATHLSPIVPDTNFYREFLICGGQIAFQGIIILALRKEKFFTYIGNMMTVSFAGGLLLIPFLLFKGFIENPMIYIAYFMLIVGLMFFEHIRRMKILKVPAIMSLTWVLYRILILSVILIK
jgi:hypothetical protein